MERGYRLIDGFERTRVVAEEHRKLLVVLPELDPVDLERCEHEALPLTFHLNGYLVPKVSQGPYCA